MYIIKDLEVKAIPHGIPLYRLMVEKPKYGVQGTLKRTHTFILVFRSGLPNEQLADWLSTTHNLISYYVNGITHF